MIPAANIKAHKLFFALLGLSLTFFMVKGIDYALMGSYVPVLVPVLILLLLLILADKPWRRVVRFWSLLLIFWAGGRLLVELLFQFAPVTETHIREQFTLIQKFISLSGLVLGFIMFKKVAELKPVQLSSPKQLAYEIEQRFYQSWLETEAFYQDLLQKKPIKFSFVQPYLSLIQSMKDAGEWRYFRLGTSMHTLVFSRSVGHGLRYDQKEIRIEWMTNTQDGFEYQVTLRDGYQVYRQFRVSELTNPKVKNLLKTLKAALID